MSNIGNRLRETRIKKGIKQGELAELLQCSSKAISRYEKNENLEKVYDFVKMCECLDADINYIVTGVEKSNGKEITVQEQQILMAYRGLIDSEKRIVDFILGIGEYNTSQILDFSELVSNASYVYVCPQKASAGIGKLEDESNPDLKLVCFDEGVVPPGSTHGIIIDGHSMEDKFFDKQIVFIQNGLECAPSDYGIFSVTDNEDTKIYCKQLMQREDGSMYLHSMNKNEGDPDIDYKNVINVHCVGKILL